MKRDEAISCLKEISVAYKDASAVTLTESKATDASIGYQLHITASLASVIDRELVKGVIEKHNLSIREENGEVVIYKAKL